MEPGRAAPSPWPGCCTARCGEREEEEQQGRSEEAKTGGGPPSSSAQMHPTITGAYLLRHGSTVCVHLWWWGGWVGGHGEAPSAEAMAESKEEGGAMGIEGKGARVVRRLVWIGTTRGEDGIGYGASTRSGLDKAFCTQKQATQPMSAWREPTRHWTMKTTVR